MNSDLVIMRPRVPAMSLKQNILDEEAILRSQGSKFLNEPEFPNYEQSMMGDELNDEDQKNFRSTTNS